jgi:DnaJ domain
LIHVTSDIVSLAFRTLHIRYYILNGRDRRQTQSSNQPRTYISIPISNFITMTNNEKYDDDYYAVLGVPYNADSKVIRKAYLKLSLQYHPDKNVNQNPAEAQAAFVRIGQAYQILSDPSQRAIYDRTYHHRFSSNNNNSKQQYRPSHTPQPAPQSDESFAQSSSQYTNDPYNGSAPFSQKQYESYREAFDTAMAGLSDDELREVMGAAALFSSVVGSIIGSRMFQNSHPAIRSLGSAVGSAIASQAAATIIKNSHADAKQRMASIDSDRQRENVRQQQQFDDSSPKHSSGYSPRHQDHYSSSSPAHQATQGTVWKDVVDNVMTGQVAKEVGKALQQVANELLNSKKHASNGK